MNASCTVLVVCLLTRISAVPAGQDDLRSTKNAIQTENDLLDSIYQDCLRKDSISCVKYKLFSFVDKILTHKEAITVTEGVHIVKTEAGEPEGAPRALSGDETFESLILDRVQRFLESHTIKIDLKGKDIVNTITSTARSITDGINSLSYDEDGDSDSDGDLTEEGRGRRKRIRRIMGPLLAAAALKMAILGKLALAGIALIAGKALLIGKMALVLSAIIGLKKLFAGQGKHVTYEVVAHPQHSSSHVSSHETVYGGGSGGGYGDAGGYSSSGHGGWGRSLEAQQLAYKGHPQAQQQII